MSNEPADEPLEQFCICSEDWCFCDATTTMRLGDAADGREWECPECAAGHHVAEMGGPRG